MSVIDQDLTRQGQELLKELSYDFGDLPNKLLVIWNHRMRSAAGRAKWPIAHIELNPRLKDISQEEIRRTFLHELAHLCVYQIFGIKTQAHGKEWKHFCTLLGIPDESATHSLNLPRRKMRKNFLYRCENCGLEVARVKRMSDSAACLACCEKYNHGKYDKRFILKGYTIAYGKPTEQ